MDSVIGTGSVAAALGTTRSRIHRAVAAGVVRPGRTSGGHLRFAPDDVQVLTQRLGVVPRLRGLSREDVLVLAALARRPLGVHSARAVGRVAGISPTAASRSLARLERPGLVRRRRQRVVRGAVTDLDVWGANITHQRWPELAPLLNRVVLPTLGHAPADHTSRVPAWLRHLFWNADVRRLDVDRDAAFIAGRILSSDDAQAHAWAAANLPPDAFEQAASVRGIEPRRAALAHNLAAAA
jgi:hypothetical protein